MMKSMGRGKTRMVGILLHREERLNSTSSVAFLKKHTVVASRSKIKMYAAAKPASYYKNEESDDDETQPPTKKQCESASRSYRPARILTRRYALTATSFKYVEIGITVGMVPDINVILGDNRGVQLKMTYTMWKLLLEQREHVQGLLHKTWDSPLRIRVAEGDEMDQLLGTKKYEHLQYKYLFAEVCAINGSNVFKVAVGNNYLYLMPSTMNCLLNLEHCIKHMYGYLYLKEWHTVRNKVREFVNIVKEKNITEKCDAAIAIRESEIFDVKSAVDCELMAFAIPDIVYIVNNTSKAVGK